MAKKKDPLLITPEEYNRRLETANLIIKENEALKKANEAKKAELHAAKQLIDLNIKKGKVIDLLKHKEEQLKLANLFISAVDKLPEKVAVEVNKILPNGLSQLQTEELLIKMKELLATVKMDLSKTDA
jgi:hypothetical protein